MNTITITVEEYSQLKEREAWANALDAAGVDNWEGVDFAHDLLEEEDE